MLLLAGHILNFVTVMLSIMHSSNGNKNNSTLTFPVTAVNDLQVTGTDEE